MSRLQFRIFSIFADIVLVNAAVLAAFTIRFLGNIPSQNMDAYLALLPLLTLGYLACGWLYDIYDAQQLDSRWATISKVASAAILGTIALTGIAYLGGDATAAFPRTALPYILVTSILFMLGWRLLFFHLGTIRWYEQRTLIIGNGDTATDLARVLIERAKWGWNLLAELPGDSSLQQVSDAITQHDINRVIITEPARSREFTEHLVLADHPKLTVDVVPELYEAFIGRPHTIVGDIPLMRLVSGVTPRYQRAIKRTVDIVGSVLLLIVTAPITLVAACAILLSDGRPIFYRQERTGRFQKNFQIYKFRTMIKNAEKSTGPVLAAKNDDRITGLGRTLRKFRIDELPQTINILRGDMSFIGPRPERPAFIADFLTDIPGYSERFRIKPGATGLAQIHGGYATTPERKLKYDLMYLYQQSPALDLQIMVETVKVVLSGKGAR
ncbi:MAG: sugar transferase [Coriobacteriia bacterium]|nr:sugar transferase [Coriobacteriia bacterium]